jgi:hypothetical protein
MCQQNIAGEDSQPAPLECFLEGEWTHAALCFYRFARLAEDEIPWSGEFSLGFGFVFNTDNRLLSDIIGLLEESQNHNPFVSQKSRVARLRFYQRWLDLMLFLGIRLVRSSL